jgi:hypothetical protein
MSQVCRNCSRPNPPDAIYCYYDGFALGGRDISQTMPLQPGTQSFVSPFVFPKSSAACRNFDELVRTAFERWEEARELLKDGSLANFLGGVGRADLARLARQAMTSPESDRALDTFLAGLPGTARQPARLHVEPAEINLGELARGQTRSLTLKIENKGMALLLGTIVSDETPWLVLGEPPGVPSKLFECRRELSVPVQILGERLRASAKTQEGKLVIESNGGSATILVRAEAPVKPFPEGVLAGAMTPRQIAEKARASPKLAAPLFEKGTVAAWYESNGWVYPIQGEQAPGLAAVQQFFEALGLTTPPRVEVSELFVRLQGPPGVAVEHTLQVTAVENRPVYLTATSNVPWLRVERPVLAGRTASLRLVVPSVPAQPGGSLLGRCQIIANGNQRFTVAVSLSIAGSRSGEGADRAPPLPTHPTPPPDYPATPPAAPPGLGEPPSTRQPEPPSAPWPPPEPPGEEKAFPPLAPTMAPGTFPLPRPGRSEQPPERTKEKPPRTKPEDDVEARFPPKPGGSGSSPILPPVPAPAPAPLLPLPPIASPASPGRSGPVARILGGKADLPTPQLEPELRNPSSDLGVPPSAFPDEVLPVLDEEPLLSIPPGQVWVPPVRPVPFAVPGRPPAEGGNLLGHLIPLGILILLLLGTVLHDILL